ncbi:tyrosine-type recombinase/integrase [Euzebya tangerina]|uniref:tyrosine-type recombinase/integrase n=1 Tax=Euzebya tangerina TaxID=591198 RepID=UPI00196B6B4D|nr:tyrosine-type recombinase/integrase [Euzebya tangerina]
MSNKHDASRRLPDPRLEALTTSFGRHLRASTRTERTIELYGMAVRYLGEWAAREGVDPLTRDAVVGYLAYESGRVKPATVANRYRSLQQFFKWAYEEDELDVDVMARLKPPKVPEQPVPVLAAEDLARLLKVCEGKGFAQRRDAAIIRLFIDTGIRLSEMAGIGVADLDLDVDKVVWVTGKGGRERACPFGRKTVRAIDRYLRVRVDHAEADSGGLWLGTSSRGQMTKSGIAQVIRRRSEEAGIGHVHPHQFRHTFAGSMRRQGLDDDSLMRLAGWRSRDMLNRYGASVADSRARERYRNIAPGDAL